MIEARGLTKRYGPVVAVDALSFDVRPGTVTGFLGPNGSGKSTTMRLIMGLDAAGRRRRPHRRPPLPRTALATSRGRFAAGGEGVPSGPQRSRASECAGRKQRDSDARGWRRCSTSSGWPAPRTGARASSRSAWRSGSGIAAALLGDPGVLLLDEPVNGLDPEGIRWIRDLLRSLAAQGRTVFVSSHLISEMALTADRLVVIGAGRLLADTLGRRAVGAGAARWRRRSSLTDRRRAEYRAANVEDGA